MTDSIESLEHQVKLDRIADYERKAKEWRARADRATTAESKLRRLRLAEIQETYAERIRRFMYHDGRRERLEAEYIDQAAEAMKDRFKLEGRD